MQLTRDATAKQQGSWIEAAMRSLRSLRCDGWERKSWKNPCASGCMQSGEKYGRTGGNYFWSFLFLSIFIQMPCNYLKEGCNSLDCDWPWRHYRRRHHGDASSTFFIASWDEEIETAGRNRGRRPSWGSKGRKWRPQADNMPKIDS